MYIRLDSVRNIRLFSVVTAISLASVFTNAAFADAVLEMCADPDKVCTCAASQLKSEKGEKDYALYEVISAAYLSNKNSGLNMVEAWDAAVKVESDRLGQDFVDTLKRTNKIGSAHRKAIEDCKG